MSINHIEVSVVVLNYFGEKLITKCLDSIYNQNFDKKKFEVIVVDNNSKDKSKKILEKYKTSQHKELILIFNNANLGFGEGNNCGIVNANGKYVALLNNDCIVDKNWLKELVITADNHPKSFAVNSKILLYPAIYKYKLESNNLNLLLTKSNLLKTVGKTEIPIKTYLLDSKYYAEIPFDKFNDKVIEISDGQKTKKINLSKNINFYHKIQNAGITVFQNGYGRDNGALIKDSLQDYEIDKRQYSKTKEVYAACGGAVLYRKDLLSALGGFDKNFFLYYEDVDISERARLLNYSIIFSPNAIAYHYHSLSAKEWSPLFIFHSEKGRLLHTFFNFPIRVFIKEYIRFIYTSVLRFLLNCNSHDNRIKNIQYIKVVKYFILNIPILTLRRIARNKNLPKKAINNNFRKIFEGYWYFN